MHAGLAVLCKGIGSHLNAGSKQKEGNGLQAVQQQQQPSTCAVRGRIQEPAQSHSVQGGIQSRAAAGQTAGGCWSSWPPVMACACACQHACMHAVGMPGQHAHEHHACMLMLVMHACSLSACASNMYDMAVEMVKLSRMAGLQAE